MIQGRICIQCISRTEDPMTSMKVLADSLLEQENLPVEMYQEFMGDIAKEIDRENKIITDLCHL